MRIQSIQNQQTQSRPNFSANVAAKNPGGKALRTSYILTYLTFADVRELLRATQAKVNAEVAKYNRSLRRGKTPTPITKKTMKLIIASCKYLGYIPKAKK